MNMLGISRKFAMKSDTRIILASGSPRRADLLKGMIADFDIVPAKVDEPIPSWEVSQAPEAWVESLAYLKAAEVAQAHPHAIIIAADTVCVHSGRIIGKPKCVDHARHILTHYFAGKGRVITGLAVVSYSECRKVITHDITELEMRAMTSEELEGYLVAGTWEGKAGAYAYQEGGDKFVKEIKGSESNVVGLPLEILQEVLNIF